MQRPLSAVERYYHVIPTMGQIGMTVSDPSVIPGYVEKLKAAILGLHVASTGTHFVIKDDDPPTEDIPEYLNLIDACDYMYRVHTPDFRNILGAIGASGKHIVVNQSRACSDGTMAPWLFGILRDPDWKPPLMTLPIDTAHLFKDKLKTYESSVPNFFADPRVTRVIPVRDADRPLRHCPHLYLSSSIEDLTCYNPRTEKADGLTEAMWASVVLSCMAFNGRVGPSGVTSCVDMLPYADPRKVSWNIGCCHSKVPVEAEFTTDSTLAQMGASMRRDLARKLSEGAQFAFLKSATARLPEKPLPGLAIELSDAGPMQIDDPIIDFHTMFQTPEPNSEPLMSFSSYSVNGPRINEWKMSLKYPSAVMHRKDASAVLYGAFFALSNLPLSTTCAEALREIKNFQTHYME
jgi:hypothetical protein